MKMIGARALLSASKRTVQVVFGYPGGSVLTLYNELDQSDITHVLTGHEQGAVQLGRRLRPARTHRCCHLGPGVCNGSRQC